MKISSENYLKIAKLGHSINSYCLPCKVKIDTLVDRVGDVDDLLKLSSTVDKLLEIIVNGVVSDNLLLNERLDKFSVSISQNCDNVYRLSSKSEVVNINNSVVPQLTTSEPETNVKLAAKNREEEEVQQSYSQGCGKGDGDFRQSRSTRSVSIQNSRSVSAGNNSQGLAR